MRKKVDMMDEYTYVYVAWRRRNTLPGMQAAALVVSLIITSFWFRESSWSSPPIYVYAS